MKNAESIDTIVEGEFMNAIRIRKNLTSQVLDLPELAPLVGKSVEIIVLEEPESPEPRQATKAGSAKGLIEMSADFDAPLEEFKDYM